MKAGRRAIRRPDVRSVAPMRFIALACDADGTLVTDGWLDAPTVAGLERPQTTGRKLILVTGRRLCELLELLLGAGLFDHIVAENGALIYDPATQQKTLLTDVPTPQLAEALGRQGVQPLEMARRSSP